MQAQRKDLKKQKIDERPKAPAPSEDLNPVGSQSKTVVRLSVGGKSLIDSLEQIQAEHGKITKIEFLLPSEQ